MRLRFGVLRRTTTATGFDVLGAGRRIRAHLDSEAVLAATMGEVKRCCSELAVEIWLTRGRERPCLVLASERPVDEQAAGRHVAASARRSRLVRSGNAVAAPIVAPRSGLLGVLRCAGVEWAPQQIADLQMLATEAGFALETANLYEQAIAERDKSDAILSRVGDAVVVTGPDGMIRDWNRGAERTTGRPRRGAVGGLCSKMIGLHAGEQSLDCRDGCPLLSMAAAHDGLGIDVWRARADGRRQPLLADVSAVFDANGVVAEVVHSLRDVSRLKEADEAKTMFLATASHELRTPLTVIQGFSQTLLALPDLDPASREQALNAMVGRSQQLNKIVDRLLLSSRIEAGRAQMAVREVDPAPLIRERIESMNGATGAILECEIAEELPVTLADPDALATILDHLIENALKYSPDGGVVRVVAGHDASAFVLEVHDDGIGMDDEQALRCFDRFWQAENSDVRRYGGTGIGLFIVRSLVEAMRGSVLVQSATGKGSTFLVRLPLSGVARDPPVNGLPTPGVGERSITKEFMRQLGIPMRRPS